MKIKHLAKILVEDYPHSEELNAEVMYLFKYTKDNGHTNVKAFHTGWNWLNGNKIVERFKKHIIERTEYQFKPGNFFNKYTPCVVNNFWGNLYLKGDYADNHNHSPYLYSFAYFVSAKWYDSPLIFSDSGVKIRPKEGRYVIFPGYVDHYVPKHRYNHSRVTLSGNISLKERQK